MINFSEKGLWLKSGYNFTPETWGCVGFGNKTTRNKFATNTGDGAILAFYVTKSKGPINKRGKVVGFAELSGVRCATQDFVLPHLWNKNPDKWPYGVIIKRAWLIVESDWDAVETIFPNTYRDNEPIHIGSRGVKVEEANFEQIENAESYEVPVFGQNQFIETQITQAKSALAEPSRPGPINKGNYSVGETDGPRYLYILKLEGSTAGWLDYDCQDKIIIKVGLSKSPHARCVSIQSNYPSGQFEWGVMFPKQFNNPPAPDGNTAKIGEAAMKAFLKDNAESLGGEFYLVSKNLCKPCFDAGLAAIP